MRPCRAGSRTAHPGCGPGSAARRRPSWGLRRRGRRERVPQPWFRCLSDELLRREELSDLEATVTLVLDDLAGLARRLVAELDDLARCGGEADGAGVEADVGQRLGLQRLALGRHDPLER